MKNRIATKILSIKSYFKPVYYSKLLLCIFWDHKGLIYFELLEANDTKCIKVVH